MIPGIELDIKNKKPEKWGKIEKGEKNKAFSSRILLAIRLRFSVDPECTVKMCEPGKIAKKEICWTGF